MPSAALIEVLEWPTPKVSYSLSPRVGKGARPSLCLMVLQPVAAAGQHLVRVGLVADVPDQPVVGRVEDVVQRDREFDRAEAGGEVAAHLADGVDQEFAQLVGERHELGRPARRRRSAGDSIVRQQRVAVGSVDIGAQFTRSASGAPPA